MLTYPIIDPVAISLGPIKVHWYGLMYLIGIGGAWLLLTKRVTRNDSPVKLEALEDLIFYAAMGIILGGRVGYVIFYNFNQFIADPLMLFKVWEGGMSFHGGLIGVVLAMWISARKDQCTMLALTDFIAPVVPVGLFFGRIGNFINAELWGRPTDVNWSFVFPGAGSLPRHPSQLYEAALEGLVLFLILWIFSNKQRPYMAVSGLFALFYGLFRFIVEFYRVPDAHLGYLAMDWLTMGQILSTPMIILGLILLGLAYSKK
ncbi:phosphatidylglycerol--prolipoprotein diacylglycerol transferase [Bathymodiolus platifrons methanotrophic gill symbiont]|uniref:prolipoprotein diacylglyceryl transferase n=1 Tax=Bathymodiolus platifrons methanotrophic gill symbiont TaxID=113268 RepID=UPI0011C8F973|nr:prolipoprotein diacylglyceryl transferase [Bathymodiolus platifrons methanotrophic gill symbiont]TXK96574.1 prolipoprotein diacylglyceryl transferase [Methylococcaceae bacterium HT1]TXL15029.1 prolipoprotein diacylglyceryl transferase [Methylococcaceae bacterium HT3]TXL23046.1 prolipoprotein diacylglyceryl transferase [Methylococcaceae bacterium HT2]GFO75448.1 phosphatidylglycerol--prolipoprotein diacylglycerol transferase [Bathymodiolus platifrons methanotrophic gill symbiont]